MSTFRSITVKLDKESLRIWRNKEAWYKTSANHYVSIIKCDVPKAGEYFLKPTGKKNEYWLLASLHDVKPSKHRNSNRLIVIINHASNSMEQWK